MNQSVTRAELVKRAAKMKPAKPKFCFGKYNGKTLQWVAESDPDYILWVGSNVSSSYWPLGMRQIYEDLRDQEEEGMIDDYDLMDMPHEY